MASQSQNFAIAMFTTGLRLRCHWDVYNWPVIFISAIAMFCCDCDAIAMQCFTCDCDAIAIFILKLVELQIYKSQGSQWHRYRRILQLRCIQLACDFYICNCDVFVAIAMQLRCLQLACYFYICDCDVLLRLRCHCDVLHAIAIFIPKNLIKSNV